MPRALVLLLFLLVGGCAAEDDGSAGLTGTFLRMRDAGFDWTSVEHAQPREGFHEIRVEVRTGTEADEQAATRAAKLVWTTHVGPLHSVAVVVNDDYTWQLDRPGLESRFGPREKNLDPVAEEPGMAYGTVLLWYLLLSLVGIGAVALIVVKLWRRARS